jgi:hypothetical protein
MILGPDGRPVKGDARPRRGLRVRARMVLPRRWAAGPEASVASLVAQDDVPSGRRSVLGRYAKSSSDRTPARHRPERLAKCLS